MRSQALKTCSAIAMLLLMWISMVPPQVLGQLPTLEWALSTGGTGADDGNALVIDAQGFAYCGGFHQQTADLDPGSGVTSAPGPAIHIQKFDPAGNLVWAVNYPSTGTFYVYDLALDAANNLVVVGTFTGTVDFDPGAGVANLAAQGGKDVFLLKLTAAGNYVFATIPVSGSGTNEIPKGLAIDSQGNMTLVGWFDGTVDCDPGTGSNLLTGNGSTDAFVAQYDANGGFRWAYSFGVNGPDSAWDVTVDAFDNVTVVGRFGFAVDFDPTGANFLLTAAGTMDGFILRLSSIGNLVWAKPLTTASGNNCTGMAIATDAYGNLVIGGIYFGSVDLDPGPGTATTLTNGTFDMFVLKTDANGNYRWSHGIGGFTGDGLYAVDADARGNVYAAGTFVGTVDFDPGSGVDTATSISYLDIAVIRYDSAGNYNWVAVAGGADNDFIRQMVVSAQNDVFVVGAYTFFADFAPGPAVQQLTTVSGADAFLYKLHLCQDTFQTTIVDTSCTTYTLNSVFYDSSGVYTQVLQAIGGCDSILTLHLTISPLQATIQQNGTTLAALPTGMTYQWLDCNNGNSPVPGATSSNFTPGATGNYAVLVTDGVCTDTSDCESFTAVGISQSLQSQLELYPNPTNGKVHIRSMMPLGTIQVANLHGQIVWESDGITATEEAIYVGAWAKGWYIVQARNQAIRLLVQ